MKAKILIVLFAMLAVFGMGVASAQPSLSITETNLDIGDTTTYTTDADNVYSLDTDVATVDESTGEIEAVGEGTATIRATVSGDYIEEDVTVSEPAASGITIETPKDELYSGEEMNLSVTIQYLNGHEEDITDEAEISIPPGTPLTYNHWDDKLVADTWEVAPVDVAVEARYEAFFTDREFEFEGTFGDGDQQPVTIPQGINDASMYIIGNTTTLIDQDTDTSDYDNTFPPNNLFNVEEDGAGNWVISGDGPTSDETRHDMESLNEASLHNNVTVTSANGESFFTPVNDGTDAYVSFDEDVEERYTTVLFESNPNVDIQLAPLLEQGTAPIDDFRNPTNGTVIDKQSFNSDPSNIEGYRVRFDFTSDGQSVDWLELEERDYHPEEYGYVETIWPDRTEAGHTYKNFTYYLGDRSYAQTSYRVGSGTFDPLTLEQTTELPEGTESFTTRVEIYESDGHVSKADTLVYNHTYDQKTDTPILTVDGNQVALVNGEMDDGEVTEVALPGTPQPGEVTLGGQTDNGSIFDWKMNGSYDGETEASETKLIEVSPDEIVGIGIDAPEQMFTNSTRGFEVYYEYASGRTETIQKDELEAIWSGDTDRITIENNRLVSSNETGTVTISAEHITNVTDYSTTPPTSDEEIFQTDTEIEVTEPDSDTTAGWIRTVLNFNTIAFILAALAGLTVAIVMGPGVMANAIGWGTTTLILFAFSLFTSVSLLLPAFVMMVGVGVILYELEGI